MNGHVRGCVIGLVAATAVGCGSGSATVSHPAPTPSVSPMPADDRVAGIIALGHSGVTGYDSDGSGGDVRGNSWVTGSNPAVDSIYLRMQHLEPATLGEVADEGIDGSKAEALEGEASAALLTVHHPQLVVIETIDNDIQCDGTDDANHAAFGAGLAAALKVIVAASPKTQILVTSQIDRPKGYDAAIKGDPNAVARAEGTGMCDTFDPSGRIVPAHEAALTAIIAGYEAEQVAVCSKVPQCHTDGGAATHYIDRLSELAPGDWGHLTITGQAHLAAVMWPTVARILNLATS